MYPIDFPERNDTLGKPDGMTKEECGDLPIARCFFPDGSTGVVSFWKLNETELELIQKTGGIYLSVRGDTHSPLNLLVDNPFPH